jgi:hypothetical protein
LVVLRDLMPNLNPSLFIVRHDAPIKIKWEIRLTRKWEIRLTGQWKQDMRDIDASLDQKNGYRSSLEKPDHLVSQTRVSSFHRENLCSNDFLKKI